MRTFKRSSNFQHRLPAPRRFKSLQQQLAARGQVGKSYGHRPILDPAAGFSTLEAEIAENARAEWDEALLHLTDESTRFASVRPIPPEPKSSERPPE